MCIGDVICLTIEGFFRRTVVVHRSGASFWIGSAAAERAWHRGEKNRVEGGRGKPHTGVLGVHTRVCIRERCWSAHLRYASARDKRAACAPACVLFARSVSCSAPTTRKLSLSLSLSLTPGEERLAEAKCVKCSFLAYRIIATHERAAEINQRESSRSPPRIKRLSDVQGEKPRGRSKTAYSGDVIMSHSHASESRPNAALLPALPPPGDCNTSSEPGRDGVKRRLVRDRRAACRAVWFSRAHVSPVPPVHAAAALLYTLRRLCVCEKVPRRRVWESDRVQSAARKNTARARRRD